MAGKLTPELQEAISAVNYAVTHLDEFPDADRVGQATIGAMAAGADIETAVGINVRLHVAGEINQSSKYLAGAVAVIGARSTNG